MKTQAKILFILLAGNYAMAIAQPALQSKYHLPRIGDELFKQQVEYKDPGRTGENVLWDFSRLQSVNEVYSLSYLKPQSFNDSLYVMGRDTLPGDTDIDSGKWFVGFEHNTLYYYHFDGSRLWKLGHENSVNLLQYTAPLLDGFFPARYGDAQTEPYHSKGIYSSVVPFETHGEATIATDASGQMILPPGDTLKQVLRTSCRQTIHSQAITETGDTLPLVNRLETCKWYSAGYRYPVFETVRNLVLSDSTENEIFATAFFYPPQEHLYLDNDTGNPAVLDGLAENSTDPWANLSYNLFPNPVKTVLNVEILLPQTAGIRYQIRNTMGGLLAEQNLGTFPAGITAFQINAASLPVNNYVLDLRLNEHLVSLILMKR